ncbi:MAG: SapC family protein [Gammaproteobacteria bacterium]|nr:SapC family protein [Gammaproteobacteria bacterium]MDG2338741.1 SapC family protein [Gammaproteobacteria bacterium]
MSTPVLLKNDKHANLKVIESGDYARYKDQHLIPIISQDFFTLSAEFPLVFVKDSSGNQFVPVAIMGLREGYNLYCQTDQWKAQVVPVRFSNAPFSIVRFDEETDQLAVLIDEDSAQLSTEEGEALFKEDGERTEYLEKKIEFLVQTAQQTVQTDDICKIFAEKDLLVTQQLQLQYRPDAPAYNIGGIYTVDEQKLNALSDEEYLDLRRQGIIPLIYAHLCSLQQLRRISELQYNADKAGETDS